MALDLPLDASLHRQIAAEQRRHGDELGSLAHLIAAQAIEAYAAGAGSAQELCTVATGYFMKGDHETAARWYRLVLLLDPDLAIAHLNLAAIHAQAGRGEAAASCRDRAYRRQRVFIESTGAALRQVLILYAGGSAGNVPVDTLLPTARCSRIKYVIDYAAEEEDGQLPPYDLVFNAIGEADLSAPLADRLERFAARCQRPLLNPPRAVARTRRHLLTALLGAVDGVAVAPCLRIESPPASRAALAECLARAGMAPPLLARPAASHGGQELVRCDSLEALDERLRVVHGSQYLTEFRDTRSADGYYRKYRMIFVDREPFAYHLAISPHWMVHYFSSGMSDRPEWLAEERRFLEDPRAALGERAMAAVAAIGRRLDLDYGGVDFAPLPDGRLLVFEANATMLVHFERDSGPLAHKNLPVQTIVAAFERLLARRSAG
ncbi:MAG TPA: hypothetical protein VMV33_11575 [Rhodocyclaceae bacterium]|nr:hypothetical protein [Rhodocyclaceae bacterium]